MAEYPKRKSPFSIQYIKAILKSDLNREIGRDAVLLAIFIVSREDDLFYKKAPKFWRAELMDRLGIGSPKALIRIRNRAVDAGILHYREGTRLKASEYWVLVPDGMMPDVFPKRNDKASTRSESGTHSGTDSGTLSKPSTYDPKKRVSVSSKKSKPIRFDASKVEIPASLRNSKFEASWLDWSRHRIEIKKPLTETTTGKLLKKFEVMGSARSITAIDHTIENGWIGIREPEQNGNGKPKQESIYKVRN